MYVCALAFAWFYLESTLLPLAFLGNDENPSVKGKPSLMGSWPTG
jgi:hypothetical protein